MGRLPNVLARNWPRLMTYRMDTTATEAQSRRAIGDEFRKWGQDGLRWHESDVAEHDFPMAAKVGETKATVRFVLRGKPITVECSSQSTYRDNLRCIFYAVHSMRMNELRGIADTMRLAYLQLAAGDEARDPYEVLGVRPDAPQSVVEMAYKGLSKERHPDMEGGSHEAMKELNDAYKRIGAERNGT